MLKSKGESKSRFQQSDQGKAFTLQELKKNLQFITLNSANREDSKWQPAEIQERLKIVKVSMKCKLDKFKKKNSKKNINKNKATILCLMPEDLVSKNVDHIFDVREEDGKVKHIAYSGHITRIVKKHKDSKQTTFEIVYDSVYNDDGDSEDEREPNKEDTYEYALLQDYHEGNSLILN